MAAGTDKCKLMNMYRNLNSLLSSDQQKSISTEFSATVKSEKTTYYAAIKEARKACYASAGAARKSYGVNVTAKRDELKAKLESMAVAASPAADAEVKTL